MRLYYNQSVFVRTKELAGRTDEVAQSGIELIGDGSMAADIQVITLACRAMQSTVPGFKIELGCFVLPLLSHTAMGCCYVDREIIV